MTTLGSAVVIFDNEEHVLLILREDLRIWALPGGSLESGETFEQAATREAFEETGYHIEITDKVGIYMRPQYPNGGNELHVFKGHVIAGDVSNHDWESIDVQWFPINALPKRLFTFSREHINDAISGATQSVKKEQTLPIVQAILLKLLLVARNIRNTIIHRTKI